jgi:hypothetical protein
MSTCSFPRDWDYTEEVGAGGALNITLPAIAGVSHVLTAVNVSAYAYGLAANQLTVANVAYSVGGAPIIYLPANIAATADEPAASPGSGYFAAGSASWAGTIAAPVGESLTVTSGSLASISTSAAMLEIQGYDF